MRWDRKYSRWTRTKITDGGSRWDLLTLSAFDVSEITDVVTIQVSGTPANLMTAMPNAPVIYSGTIASTATPGGITNCDSSRLVPDLSEVTPMVPADRFSVGTALASQGSRLCPGVHCDGRPTPRAPVDRSPVPG